MQISVVYCISNFGKGVKAIFHFLFPKNNFIQAQTERLICSAYPSTWLPNFPSTLINVFASCHISPNLESTVEYAILFFSKSGITICNWITKPTNVDTSANTFTDDELHNTLNESIRLKMYKHFENVCIGNTTNRYVFCKVVLMFLVNTFRGCQVRIEPHLILSFLSPVSSLVISSQHRST